MPIIPSKGAFQNVQSVRDRVKQFGDTDFVGASRSRGVSCGPQGGGGGLRLLKSVSRNPRDWRDLDEGGGRHPVGIVDAQGGEGRHPSVLPGEGGPPQVNGRQRDQDVGTFPLS